MKKLITLQLEGLEMRLAYRRNWYNNDREMAYKLGRKYQAFINSEDKRYDEMILESRNRCLITLGILEATK